MSPALIAIDWGSSSFRAYLLSPGGEVLEEIASGDGIAGVAAGAYPATLRRLGWALDPRSFKVHTIAAPEEREKSLHYLQRFWERLPRHGQIVAFDRSWYCLLYTSPSPRDTR